MFLKSNGESVVRLSDGECVVTTCDGVWSVEMMERV